jgi:sortase A
MKQDRPGTPLVVLGAIFLAAAICFAGINIRDNYLAERAALDISEALMDAITVNANRERQAGVTSAELLSGDPVVTVGHAGYIGLLEIPALGLTLPVRADWSYDQLRESPCRFSGSCQDNNLVICAHNYPSHFGKLLDVDIGVDIYLTTADSRIHHYIVENREILPPTDVEGMISREQGEWNLTLFTCTIGGRTRCAVRCQQIPDPQ